MATKKKSTAPEPTLLEKIGGQALHLKDELVAGTDHLLEAAGEKLSAVTSSIKKKFTAGKKAVKPTAKKAVKKVVKKSVKKVAKKVAAAKKAVVKKVAAKKKSPSKILGPRKLRKR